LRVFADDERDTSPPEASCELPRLLAINFERGSGCFARPPVSTRSTRRSLAGFSPSVPAFPDAVASGGRSPGSLLTLLITRRALRGLTRAFRRDVVHRQHARRRPVWPNRCRSRGRHRRGRSRFQTSTFRRRGPASIAETSESSAGRSRSYASFTPRSVSRVARTRPSAVRCRRRRQVGPAEERRGLRRTCHVSESPSAPKRRDRRRPPLDRQGEPCAYVPSVSAQRHPVDRLMHRSAPRARHVRNASAAWGGP